MHLVRMGDTTVGRDPDSDVSGVFLVLAWCRLHQLQDQPYLIRVEVEEVTLACTVYLTDMERVWWEVVKEAQFTNRWNTVAPSAVKLAKSLISIRVKNVHYSHPGSYHGYCQSPQYRDKVKN